MENEFAIGDTVAFMTFDGAEFQGILEDFTDYYFTLGTKKGILGFPFETIKMMWAV